MTWKNCIVSGLNPNKLLTNQCQIRRPEVNIKKEVYDLQQTERILENYFVKTLIG